MSRGDVPGLRLTDEDVGLLSRVDYDILVQGLIGLIEYSYHQDIPYFRIDRILVPPRYTFFSNVDTYA
jgi:hypothetical protein